MLRHFYIFDASRAGWIPRPPPFLIAFLAAVDRGGPYREAAVPGRLRLTYRIEEGNALLLFF